MNHSKSNLSIFMIMFGFTFFSGSMLVGKQLSDGLSITTFIASLLAGGTILGLFGGFLAYIGCKNKSDMRELTTKTFGFKGSWIPSILIGITQIGWYGVGISMFAVPVSGIIAPNSRFALILCILIFGGVMTFSTYIGLKSITRISFVAVPIILILGIAIIIYGFKKTGIEILSAFGYNDSLNVIYGVELVTGTYISGSITTPNFTKFGKHPLIVSIISFSAFLIGNGLMILFGAFSNIIVGGDDIFDLFTYFDCKFLGVIVLGLNIWSSCDNGLYSAGLELENIFRISHKWIIVITGIISTLFSLFLYNNFISFLVMMNRTLPPIGIVLILDNFYRKEAKNFTEVNIFNTISIFIGALCGLLINDGIPAINGILITVALFFFGQHFLVQNKKTRVQ